MNTWLKTADEASEDVRHELRNGLPPSPRQKSGRTEGQSDWTTSSLVHCLCPALPWKRKRFSLSSIGLSRISSTAFHWKRPFSGFKFSLWWEGSLQDFNMVSATTDQLIFWALKRCLSDKPHKLKFLNHYIKKAISIRGKVLQRSDFISVQTQRNPKFHQSKLPMRIRKTTFCAASLFEALERPKRKLWNKALSERFRQLVFDPPNLRSDQGWKKE